MQKKRPILRRAWDFIAVTTITPLGKVARRRIANCCCFCCSGGGSGRQLALFKRARRLSLLRHYSYHFIGEYEFSPDNTPLFPRGRGWGAPRKRPSRLLRLLMCGGGGGDSRGVGGVEAIGWQEGEWETTAEGNVEASCEGGQEPPEAPAPSEWSTEDGDEESVDRRAEMFIERFYDEMRIQRQDSDVEYAEMLDGSC